MRVLVLLTTLASACLASRESLRGNPVAVLQTGDELSPSFRRGLLEDEDEQAIFASCVGAQMKKVANSCGNSKAGLPRDTLTRLLKTCLPSESTSSNNRTIRFLISAGTYNSVIRSITSVYQSMTGVPISVITPPFNEIDKLRAPSLAKPADLNTTHEVWFMSPSTVGDGMATGALKDVTDLVILDKRLEWYSILPVVRQALLYKSRVIGLPLSAYVMTMVYRIDVFDRNNITTPRTWRELLDVARKYNGTEDKYAYCGQWYGCASSAQFTVRMIAGTLTQTMGLSHGSAIDPETMLPLYDTPAMSETFDIIRELYSLTAPEARIPTNCTPQAHLFYQGKCLITLDTPANIKLMSHTSNAAMAGAVQGNIGAAQIPGSDRVLDRATNTLVPCSPEICPYATRYTNADGSTFLVNIAPTYAAGILAINDKLPPDLSFFTFGMLSYFCSTEVRLPMILDPAIDVFPVRKQSLSTWIAAGYNPADIERWLLQHDQGINHPNLNVNLRSQGGPRINRLNGQICVNITNTTMTNAELRAAAQAQAVALFNSIYKGNMTAFKVDYWSSLNRDIKSISSPSPASTSEDASLGSQDGSLSAGGVAGVVIGAVAVAVLLLVLAIRSRLKLRSKGGSMENPGVGPASTLLVTDIENSTQLWEELPAEVMDAAVKLHNALIRNLAAEHQGYQSIWEGDSFIIAFHNPQAAVSFSISLQLELLHLAWPPLLLASKVTQEVWLKRLRNTSKVPEAPAKHEEPSNESNPPGESQDRASCDPTPDMDTLEFSILAAKEPSVHAKDVFNTGDMSVDSLFTQQLDTESLAGLSNYSLPTCARPDSMNGSLRRSGKLPTLQSIKLKRSKSRHLAQAELLGTRVQRSWIVCSPNTSGAILCYRGLRVRIGMHSGIDDASHINFNSHMRRYHYTGPVRTVAAAVASAGHGGMVLLSSNSLEQLISIRAATGAKVDYSFYHTGCHDLADLPESLDITQALPTSLVCRLAVQQEPLRSKQCTMAGVLASPLPCPTLGSTTLVYVQVLSVESLLNWNHQQACSALTSARLCAHEQVTKWHGVLSEDGLSLSCFASKAKSGLLTSLPAALPGRLVVAFRDAQAALQFALHLRHALLLLDWESDLLSHELCEPLGSLPERSSSTAAPLIVANDGGDSDGDGSEEEGQQGQARKEDLSASYPNIRCAVMDTLNDDASSIASRPALMIMGPKSAAGSETASSFSMPRPPAILMPALSVTHDNPPTPKSDGSGKKEGSGFVKQLAKRAKKGSKAKGLDFCEFDTPMLRGLRTKCVVIEASDCHCQVKIATHSSGRLLYVYQTRLKKQLLAGALKSAKPGQILVSSSIVQVATEATNL